MAKVGDLKAYHDGASYSVAELYDAEISTIQKGEAKLLVHFDLSNGVVDDCEHNWDYYHSDTVAVPTIITDTTVFNYALESVYNSNNAFVSTDTTFEIGGADFTIDGFFYFDTSTAVKKAYNYLFWFAPQSTASNGALSTSDYLSFYCGVGVQGNNTSATTAMKNWRWVRSDIFGKTLGTTKYNNITYQIGKVDDNSFDTLAHFAIVYEHDKPQAKIFLNGENVFTSSIYSSIVERKKLVLCTIGGRNASASNKLSWVNNQNFNGEIYEIRVVDGAALYTEDFTPPNLPSALASNVIPVTGNVALKTASGTLYAPLSSDATYKTPPCLNVRHNGTNYFAIK